MNQINTLLALHNYLYIKGARARCNWRESVIFFSPIQVQSEVIIYQLFEHKPWMYHGIPMTDRVACWWLLHSSAGGNAALEALTTRTWFIVGLNLQKYSLVTAEP